MKRIDTSKWKEFRVGELFDIHPTKAYPLNNAKLLDGGETPVVVNSSYNNGIGGFSSKEPTEKGGMITFSDTVDAYTIFYQENDFVGYPHVQGLYPVGEYASFWSEYSLKFFATIFRQKAVNNSFDYSYKFRRDIAINLNVLLPVTPFGTPDWQFMENYMRDKEQQTTTSIKALKRVTQSHKPKRIDTSNWKEFYVGKLFPKIIKPRVYHSHEVKEEISGVPYIVRSKFNNGIKYRVNRNGIVTSPKGVISFGAENASFFYQEEEWCSGRDIYYIDTREIPSYSCRFLAVCLNRLTEKYSYNYGLFPELLKMEKILLPVTQSGEPDWNLMEQYMQQVEMQVKNSIIALTTPAPQIQQVNNITNYGTVYIYEK